MNKKLIVLIVALECVFSVFLISIFGPMIESHSKILVEDIYLIDENREQLKTPEGEEMPTVKIDVPNDYDYEFRVGVKSDDATDKSVTEIMGAKPNIKKLEQGDLFCPFIDMLKAGYGTLAYQDSWNLFDIMVVSENLATGSTGSLKLKKAEGSKFYGNIFRRDYMIQKEGQYKGYPLRSFVGNNFQNGFADHFPVYIYITK